MDRIHTVPCKHWYFIGCVWIQSSTDPNWTAKQQFQCWISLDPFWTGSRAITVKGKRNGKEREGGKDRGKIWGRLIVFFFFALPFLLRCRPPLPQWIHGYSVLFLFDEVSRPRNNNKQKITNKQTNNPRKVPTFPVDVLYLYPVPSKLKVPQNGCRGAFTLLKYLATPIKQAQ